MTGEHHYRTAESLIDIAREQQTDNGPSPGSTEALAEAQIHATLAAAYFNAPPDAQARLAGVDQ